MKPISFKVVDGQISDKKLDATTWDQVTAHNFTSHTYDNCTLDYPPVLPPPPPRPLYYPLPQAATDEVSRLVNTMLITCQVVALRPSGLIEVMMWTQSQKSDKVHVHLLKSLCKSLSNGWINSPDLNRIYF